MELESNQEAPERKVSKSEPEVADCKEEIPDTTGTAKTVRAGKLPEDETRKSTEQPSRNKFFRRPYRSVLLLLDTWPSDTLLRQRSSLPIGNYKENKTTPNCRTYPL